MSPAAATLTSLVDAAFAAGTLQRVLLGGAEGLGRTHLLSSLPHPVLRVDAVRGVVTGTLRALLDTTGSDETTWLRLLAAPQLSGLRQAIAAASETLAENWTKNTFLPFHPGAARFYKEQGIQLAI
jgi:hypothetical protein